MTALFHCLDINAPTHGHRAHAQKGRPPGETFHRSPRGAAEHAPVRLLTTPWPHVTRDTEGPLWGLGLQAAIQTSSPTLSPADPQSHLAWVLCPSKAIPDQCQGVQSHHVAFPCPFPAQSLPGTPHGVTRSLPSFVGLLSASLPRNGTTRGSMRGRFGSQLFL